MSTIPRDFIDLLLTKIDLVDLINERIPLAKKSGNNYFARCPFHNEKSASFSVSQPKQFYYCFGCGASGNAIDFLMNHDRLLFPEAVEALARHAGMPLPKQIGGQRKEESHEGLFELMSQANQAFYEQMRHSKRAIDYLKQRGITGRIAQQFSIGYAPSGWNFLLDQFGKTEEQKKKLLEVGLIIKKSEGGFYDRFRDRIMFPIQDYRGRIIGFGGRILDQGEPKYLNSPETVLFQKGHELYGLYQALKLNRHLERVLIVEGYMDVIALFQHGITYATATLGTATSAHHLQRLFRYTSDIIFCFDGDEAGRTAAWRALQVIFPLMQDSLQIRFLFLPEGEDPDSLIRKEGQEAFEKRIEFATSLSTFFFQALSRQSDMNSLEGRARFAASAMTFIKTLPESIFQNMMLEELAKRARVEHQSLKKEIPQSIQVVKPNFQDVIKSKLPPALRTALSLLIQNPALGLKVDIPLPNTGGCAFLVQVIDIIKNEEGIRTTGALLERWRGQKEGEFLSKMAALEHNIPENGMEQEFLGALRQLNLLYLDQEINKLLTKAEQDGLSVEEKMQLTHWIAKKKTLAVEDF